MKPIITFSLALAGVLALASVGGLAGRAASAPDAAASDPHDGAPRYDVAGRLIFPADYRDWMFLSSGLNMSYNPAGATPAHDAFGNNFVPRAAYEAFRKTGHWPDKTVIVIENRGGATKGSINKHGVFQTAQWLGMEAHVRDEARFKGGWGFFGFSDQKPATQIPYAAECYSCHQAHAAVDTTFVQFYPTLLPVATDKKTLSPAYLADEAAAK